MAQVLLAGSWAIPGIGEVVIAITAAAAAVIKCGPKIIEAGSDAYDTIVNFFSNRSEIKRIENNILSSLKKDCPGDEGNHPKDPKDKIKCVDLSKFTKKKNDENNAKEDPKSRWYIQKDTAGHGGRKWKLKNDKGDRIASLDENGRILKD